MIGDEYVMKNFQFHNIRTGTMQGLWRWGREGLMKSSNQSLLSQMQLYCHWAEELSWQILAVIVFGNGMCLTLARMTQVSVAYHSAPAC